MIKLIIFDLDGVLVDAKDIHFNALNRALEEVNAQYSVKNIGKIVRGYTISREEHLSKYDGLNTKAKLELLTKEKGLPKESHEDIFKLKQKYTLEEIKKIKYDAWLYGPIEKIKKELNLQISVASNSIRETVKTALISTRLIDIVDFYLSNEDVKYPKPNTEIYLQAMIKAGVSPKETLIIEDSYIGRQGADQTGALVMGVNSPADVTYENIKTFIDKHEKISKPSKWKDPKLNIVIPMAGAGSRFAQAGYTFPKPLIEVHGKPMIQTVVENLNIDAHYIYIINENHHKQYNLRNLLNLLTPGCDIVHIPMDTVTEGAAITTLLARGMINNDNPLLIANSDQFIEWNSGEFMYSMTGDHVDAGIVTFKATHPKWSFAKVENGFVTQVAEKNPISDTATVGVYYWKKGSDYVKYAEQMIKKNIRTNNEFYVCPVFNEAILDGKKIKTFNVDKMYGLGTPEDLNYYLENYDRH